MAAYAGMVDCLDQSIGRLVRHLEELQELDNTIIMFCSDNGACPFERTRGKELRPWNPKSYWTYDKGWAHVGNTPFRWYKQNQHEGGISSPLIISWAGLKTEPGMISDQPAHLIDFMPTCLELADANYPTSFSGRSITPAQGRSMVPIFADQQRAGHEWLYFQFSNNRALRKGDYKLVSVKGRPWELYDLSIDRSELRNLADSERELTQELQELWHEVAQNVEKAPLKMRGPVGKTSGGKR